MGRAADAKLESEFQAKLIKTLTWLFPGCHILKNDSEYQTGIPDLTILWGVHWAVLEVKAYEGAPEQPNQGWYIEKFDAMSYAAFIYPENAEDVLYAIQQAFGIARPTLISVG